MYKYDIGQYVGGPNSSLKNLTNKLLAWYDEADQGFNRNMANLVTVTKNDIMNVLS